MDEIADLSDVLVVCRSRYELHMNQLITKFKSRGKPVFFDVDDLVFDPSCVHLIMNTLAQDTESQALWDYWFAYTSRMQQALLMCDGAITTNDFLAQRITDQTQLPAVVIPNFMNQEQWEISKRIYEHKKAQGFARQGPLTVGYFSGSPSHQLDFAIVESALVELMSNHPDLKLVVAGYIETGKRLAPYAKRIHYEPFQDYVNLQRLVASVDINLMPLQSNVFTHCKSELKYFEAAAVGTLSVASPSFTYARAIEDGVNGRLAKAHEWERVIEELIQTPANYPSMAQKAWDHVQSEFTWESQRDGVLRALGLRA
jgi:glycosyltransferase involved in cell wall biosynthesis